MHIRNGDNVEVIAGNDRGARHKVLRVFPERERALVMVAAATLMAMSAVSLFIFQVAGI